MLNNTINKNSNTATTEVTSEIAELLFKDTYKVTITSFSVAAVLLFVLGNSVSTKVATIWALILLLAYGLRHVVVNLYLKDASRAANAQQWLNRFNLTSAFSGLVWGSTCVMMYPSNNTELQAILGLTLAGVCAGSLISYSIKFSTALLFVGGVAVLSVPVFLNDGSLYARQILTLASFFVLFVALTTRRLANDLLNNLKTRISVEKDKNEIILLSQRQNLHMAHTPMGVIEWDSELFITSWNKACTTIFGYTEKEAVGKHLYFLMPDLEKKSQHETVQFMLSQEANLDVLRKMTHKNGDTIFCEWFNTLLKDANEKVVGIASLVQDKTAFVKTQNKMHQLAYYDSLTNLPSRGLLIDRLEQAISFSKRSKAFGMVIYLDLDSFNVINNSRGHAAGDHFLLTIANRLQKAIRKQDTVARMGGDEFVMVLSDIGKTSQKAHAFSLKLIEKITQAVRVPVEYDGHQLRCSASSGVCIFTGDAINAEEVLRRADMSMYLAKKQGRNTYQYYDETMQPKFDYQLELKKDLTKALADNQFQLYLQGQFNKDSKAIGAEVLLRWQHPKYGLVMPADFIPLVEESGFIVPIGTWLIHQACAQLKKWEASPLTNKLTLSVNVSAVQFNHINFISDIESALELSGCDATLLCIELTESAVINSIEDIVYKMNYLSSMGISLSIDDFGIGYSSLFMLKRLPINELKIDKSFVQDITKGHVEGALAQTILQMGKNLQLDVVAEGVETEYQMEFLRNHGCKVFQGYLFQKPCNTSEFEKALALKSSVVDIKSANLIKKTQTQKVASKKSNLV